MLRIFLSILFLSQLGLAYKFSGMAKDKEGKEVYFEQHQVVEQGDVLVSIDTRYLRPDKKTEFAYLKSSFAKHPYVPELEFYDERFNVKAWSTVEGNKVTLHKEYMKRGKKRVDTKSFEIEDRMMLSQGYHNYIVKNLDSFKVGEEFPIKFLAAKKLDYYDFRLKYHGPISEGADIVKLELIIDNWLIKMFAPSIVVTYNKKTKRLLSFSGLTNIPSDGDDNQNLSMTYTIIE